MKSLCAWVRSCVSVSVCLVLTGLSWPWASQAVGVAGWPKQWQLGGIDPFPQVLLGAAVEASAMDSAPMREGGGERRAVAQAQIDSSLAARACCSYADASSHAQRELYARERGGAFASGPHLFMALCMRREPRARVRAMRRACIELPTLRYPCEVLHAVALERCGRRDEAQRDALHVGDWIVVFRCRQVLDASKGAEESCAPVWFREEQRATGARLPAQSTKAPCG